MDLLNLFQLTKFKFIMKRNVILFAGRGMFLPLILLALFTFSCSSDNDKDDKSQVTFENNYFSVVNGEFANKDLPATNDADLGILGLTGNSTVLAGGSNPISIITPDNATDIIVGVEGHKGYFSVPVGTQTGNVPMSTSASNTTSMQLLIGREITEGFTLSFAALNSLGQVGAYKQLEVNYLEAGTGKLHISLSWDQENDVDLHLIEPNGERIYYGNRSSLNGGELDLDSNPACQIDNINNENIFYEEDSDVIIEYGEYEVQVDLYAACNITDATNIIMSVYYGNALIATTEGQNPHTGVLMPSDYGDYISIMKFNIQGEPASRGQEQNLDAPAVFQFNFKDQDKVERPQILSPQKM